MSRYIDADALKENCYKQMDKLMESTSEHLSAEALSLLCGFTLIDSAPSIDIVRCSECIFDTDYYFKNDVKQHRYEWCYEFCDVNGHCPFGKKRSEEEREGE